MLVLKKSNLISLEQKRRINRSSYECLYLLESIITGHSFILKIIGSTLNVYTIKLVDNILSCNCMDKLKNIYCKHICFVICSIGKIYDEETFNRNSLSDKEVQSIYKRINNNCDNDPNIIWKYIIDKYNIIKNTENKFDKKESININSECSICYDNLNNDDNLAKCPYCKNAFHISCIEKWIKINKTCVLCRNNIWKEFNKYLNLG